MTIWLLVGALALLAMLPLAVVVFRPARARGRAEADLALYRAQLAELDRERDAGRLDATAHTAATLEVQRRILTAPKDDAASAGRSSAAIVAAALFLLPAAAIGLYMVRGIPEMPSAPYDLRRQQMEAEEQMLSTLRGRIAQLDPNGEPARQGYPLRPATRRRPGGAAYRAAEPRRGRHATGARARQCAGRSQAPLPDGARGSARRAAGECAQRLAGAAGRCTARCALARGG
jgi:cytochrome c-type biogenesis protein CcmH